MTGIRNFKSCIDLMSDRAPPIFHISRGFMLRFPWCNGLWGRVQAISPWIGRLERKARSHTPA